jgi:hypothetical protein
VDKPFALASSLNLAAVPRGSTFFLGHEAHFLQAAHFAPFDLHDLLNGIIGNIYTKCRISFYLPILMTEKLTKFIKISNNNNPSVDFCIESTIQKNASSRISALKTQYNMWVDGGRQQAQRRTVFRWFDLDYSFYVVHRETCTKSDTRSIKEALYKNELIRLNPTLFPKGTEEEIRQVERVAQSLKQGSYDLAAPPPKLAGICAF